MVDELRAAGEGAPVLKFLYEALSTLLVLDQAACIYEALAWSYEQSRAYDPPGVSDALTPPLSFGKSAPDKYLEMSQRAIVLWHHRVGDADCLEEVICSKDHARASKRVEAWSQSAT